MIRSNNVVPDHILLINQSIKNVFGVSTVADMFVVMHLVEDIFLVSDLYP